MDDVEGGYQYPSEVRFQVFADDREAYRRAAELLNFSNIDVVSLQHEFGIFGGPAGSNVLTLLRDLRMPVVTTLHTVLSEPSQEQMRVMKQLADLSGRLTVMSERGKQLLHEIYGVPSAKIDLIPHGIPDMPFVDPNFYKDQFGAEGKQVMLTFGLLSPNKGIEYVIRALPEVLRHFPNLIYVVVGATHPNVVREQGEAYRESLKSLAGELGIGDNVTFFDRYVELEELIEFIGAADIYITPYLNRAQITSGTLAYAFGSGKAVISTPYWHAEELLGDGRGILVPFADSEVMSGEIIALLRDEKRRHAMRKQAYLIGRQMIWSCVAKQFFESFVSARQLASESPRQRRGRLAEDRGVELPSLRLDHLLHMTDDTGLLQHANYTVPNRREGYCTDDNVRALALCMMLEELGEEAVEIAHATSVYASFLEHALDRTTGCCKNFMGFDRQWLEQVGSDDSLGRTVWALGTCIGRSLQRDFHFWALELFERSVQACIQTSSPRCWAHALLGIHEYMKRLNGDRMMTQVRETLMTRLMNLFHRTASSDWPWFESSLAYDNARLPHALLVSGHDASNGEAARVGLESLRWLVDIQRSSGGWFRPIGNCNFCHRGQSPARFDQQPIEAHATTSACLAAYQITADAWWLAEGQRAFNWFLGHNDLRLPLYDATTGGCRDGLQQDRVNQNQGAESTLAFLLSLAELKLSKLAGGAARGSKTPMRLPLTTN
jgi:glycosyltransferase involved in cell wall biosynthesis